MIVPSLQSCLNVSDALNGNTDAAGEVIRAVAAKYERGEPLDDLESEFMEDGFRYMKAKAKTTDDTDKLERLAAQAFHLAKPKGRPANDILSDLGVALVVEDGRAKGLSLENAIAEAALAENKSESRVKNVHGKMLSTLRGLHEERRSQLSTQYRQKGWW